MHEKINQPFDRFFTNYLVIISYELPRKMEKYSYLKMNRRREILLVGARLFRKKGFLGTSLDDIASRVKINKATIFYYFKSKDQLLYEIVSTAINEIIEKANLIKNSDISPLEKMKALVKLHLDIGTDPFHLGGVALFERKNLRPKLRKAYDTRRDTYEQIYRDVFREGIVYRQFRESDPVMTARFILGVINSVTIWFKRKGSLSLEQVGEEAWRYISCSIQNYDQSKCITTPLDI